jgi:DNA-binding transcriptional LysR family regulator
MDFRKLKYVLAVAKDRSFTLAAKRIHISQSAISEQVRLLEDEVGFPIFNRTSRGIQLTDHGRLFLHEAERVYNELLGLTDKARALHGGGDFFVLGIGSGLAHLVVPRAMGGFSKKFPRLRLEVKISPTRRIYDQLHDERIDAGIAVESEPAKLPAGIIQERMFESDMVLLLPSSHEIVKLEGPISLDSLVETPLIMNELGVGYGQIVQSMFDAIGVRPNIVGIADNIDTIRVMVTNKLGIAILPEACIEPLHKDSKLLVKRLSSYKKIAFCLLRRQQVMTKNREIQFEFLRNAMGIDE